MNRKYSAFIGVNLIFAFFAIFAGYSLVAINPAKNFADARDASRRSDITVILNGISQYNIENYDAQLGADSDGDMIPNCDNEDALEIGVGIGYYDLDDGGRFIPDYLVALPFDPYVGTAGKTGYTICQSTNGRFTISAPDAENSDVVSVTR